ncbi:hypothetical protein INR49_001787 [Caranx melampygus]|nr:hypothetical protein INR49_001787 [Caranx melampygus]
MAQTRDQITVALGGPWRTTVDHEDHSGRKDYASARVKVTGGNSRCMKVIRTDDEPCPWFLGNQDP